MLSYQDRAGDWRVRRGQRIKRWMLMRVGLWLVMVAAVLGLNLLLGGNGFWGIGFIIITGTLLLIRLAFFWSMSRRLRGPGAVGPGRRWRGEPLDPGSQGR